jgi:hypothetical protein
MGLFDDLIPQQQRAPVQATPRVWGDKEAEAAGLYEAMPARALPGQPGQPRIEVRPQGSTATADITFDDLIPPDASSSVASAPAATAKPDIGQGRAGGIGALRGATFNFADEIRGVQNAAGLPDWVPGGVDAMVGLARLGYEYMQGGDDAAKRYREGRDQFREMTRTAQEQYPNTTMVGEIGGAIAAPLGAARAVTMGGRMATGAAIGGGAGALSGAGEGETLPDRAGRALTGGAIGTVAGAALPAAIEGVTRATRGALQPVRNAVRGVFNPEDEAARRVAMALERDIGADPQAATRLRPQEFAASQQSGGPARIMDIGGDTTRALARSAANTSPEGRGVINRTINDRYEGQGARVTNWLEQTFHYPNTQAQQEALEQTARNVNRGNYARAYRDGQQGLWSPELERLAGSDAVSAAMQSAARNAKDEAIISGYGAMNPRITFTQDGRMQFNRGPNGVPTYPDLQYWDLVRRELSDAARKLPQGTTESRRLNTFATALNAELDNLVPSYRTARQGAASFFNAENALEAGENFVMSNFDTRAVRQALGRMSPTERQLFQDGFVSRFTETLNRVGDRRNILNSIGSNPQAREKLNIALGPQRAAELETGLRVEGIMDLARGAVQGNSTTARQLVELGLAGGAYGAGTGFDLMNPNPSALVSAALVWGVARGKGRINENVARRVAEMLVSNDPQIVLRGVRVVAQNRQMMGSLRALDQRLARIGGQQAPVPVPALSAAGIGHAEDNQPPIPRPPGQ